MADLQFTVDFTDLNELNKVLNDTKNRISMTAKDSSREYERLKRSIDPAYNALRNVQRQVVTAQRALATGAITNEEYARSLTLIQSQAERAGFSVNQFGQVASVNTRRLKRFSAVGLQQVGYQVGDFAVQLQSGTNAAVAFGQQASQLLGIFGAGGAIAGAAVAIGTAFVAPLIESRRRAKELGDTFKTVAEQIREMRAEIELFNSGLATAGELQQQNRIDELEREIAVIEMLARRGIGDKRTAQDQEESRNRLESLREELDQLRQIREERQRQRDIEELTNQERLLGEQLLEAERERIYEQVTLSRELQRSVEDQVRSLQQQISLQAIINQFGKDSIAVERLKNQQALENLRIELERRGLSEDQINLILRQHQALQAVSGSTAEAAAKAHEMAKEIADAYRSGESLASLNLSIGIAEAARVAAILANNMGISLNRARGIVALARVGGRGPDQARFEVMDRYTLPEPVDLDRDKPKKSREIPDPLGDLVKRVELERQLLGATEARKRVLEAIHGSEREYSQEAIDSAIERVAAYNAEREALETIRNQQQALADTLESSMSDAVMSIVDGTKTVEEAFREMARQILSHLWEVLVMQQAIGSWNSTTGEGSGIVGAIMGSFTPGKASGGSIMAGTPYMVGERGPEMIVPKHSGTVMNADLTKKAMSGGDPVVQNFTFNLSANGDESVKRIIASQVPTITEAAKSAVLDERLRGGRMKRAFN